MNYRQLAKIFTSSNISKVAAGDLELVQRITSEFPSLRAAQTLHDIFEESYKLLCKHYPNEYVVKNIIANNILLGTHSLNTASMLSELRIGSNKADCVIINGHSTCYEIKTKFDSLKRLPEQLLSYTSSFDKTYVVTHETHLAELLEIHESMPKFGILILNERKQLSRKIEAPLNTNFDTDLMFHTLRKEEYTEIAKLITGSIPSCSPTDLFRQCKEIFCNANNTDANEYFKKVLKRYRKNDHNFVTRLPRSMKNLGISYNIHTKEKDSILSYLSRLNNLNKEMCNVLPIHEGQAV